MSVVYEVTRAPLTERLTWSQIVERFPLQWVVLVEHDWRPGTWLEHSSARVATCGRDRKEAVTRAFDDGWIDDKIRCANVHATYDLDSHLRLLVDE
ncbi:MAG TPA: hypothetical protein VGM88_17655 [Kofleriaceae bacterium]|jgi:hypothetical protein